MGRKLFCELSPFTYWLSVKRCCTQRNIKDKLSGATFASSFSQEKLPVCVVSHKSLIRRKLGNVDMKLQENKAVNLSLAAPKVNGILIYPGQVFSFWHLVGNCTARKGFREGLTIVGDHESRGVGGGMCQFTNLIHWMVLHTPFERVEHHHHDQFDLFPDFNRQIPFGTGTSIMFNYLDYRFKNNTDRVYQLITYTTDEYLCGELRCSREQPEKYHIESENEHFEHQNGKYYRCGEVYRKQIDKKTGNVVNRELLHKNHALVMYDGSNLDAIEVE